MRLLRDLDGEELARLERRHGYELTRQVGSHIRLATLREGNTTSLLPATGRYGWGR